MPLLVKQWKRTFRFGIIGGGSRQDSNAEYTFAEYYRSEYTVPNASRI